MKGFWASGLPAALLFAFGIAWSGAMALTPRPGEPVAAIFPVSMAAADAFSGVIGAGADTILATGAVDTIVIATSLQPDFIDRLMRAGAVVVVRAPFAGYCAS